MSTRFSADAEEREIQRLTMQAVEAQQRKLALKMNLLDEMDRLCGGDKGSFEAQRQRALAELAKLKAKK